MTLQETTSSLYNQLLELAPSVASDAIAATRNSALATFREKGFPTAKHEDWRFTNLTPYVESGFSLNPTTPDDERIREAVSNTAIPGVEAYELVLVNGQVRSDLSTLPNTQWVSIEPIQNAVSAGIFNEYLQDKTFTGSESLLAINTALFTHGCYIQVHKETVVDKPIRIIHVYGAEENVFFQPRHLWIVNRHAQVSIIEQSVVLKGQGLQSMANAVSRIVLKEDARLTHYELQQNAPGERWLHYNRVSQQRGSRYDNFTFTFPGADLVRNNMEMALEDSGTETHLYGLYLVGSNQLTDNHTAIAHQYPSCESNQLYKGVITGNGKAVFNGKVLVARDAQQTNAYQQNNNLLLSDQARVYAKPQLEIYADDVKCSHGCTVGQFNPESLFYLRARGIDEEAARNLLVEAFAFDITNKMEDDAIRAYVQQLIHESMIGVSLTK